MTYPTHTLSLTIRELCIYTAKKYRNLLRKSKGVHDQTSIARQKEEKNAYRCYRLMVDI